MQSFKNVELDQSTEFEYVDVACTGDDSLELISGESDKQIEIHKINVSAQGACTVEIIQGITNLFTLYMGSYTPVFIDLSNSPIKLPTNTALDMNGGGSPQNVHITIVYKILDV